MLDMQILLRYAELLNFTSIFQYTKYNMIMLIIHTASRYEKLAHFD